MRWTTYDFQPPTTCASLPPTKLFVPSAAERDAADSPTQDFFAGEIVTNLPDKEVTVVCAGGRLIPDKPPSIGQRALEYLEKRGAKVPFLYAC